MSADRKVCRQALATLLASSVTLEQAVYNYQVGDFQGQSPVLVVTSAGTEQTPGDFEGDDTTFYFNIHVFVLYADPDASWTEQNAEDTLDDIEKQIRAMIADNQVTANWSMIRLADRSVTRPIVIGGDEYRHEVFPVAAEVYG